MALAMDTLQIADDLEASGIERGQAKAIAHAVRQGQGDSVTKADLDAGLAALEARLTWRLVGAMAAQAALIVALLKLL